MKATLDLPDDLMRAIRMRAAREERTLKDVTTDLLRRGLSAPDPAALPEAGFPSIVCSTAPGALTPDDVHAALLDGDADALTQ